MAYYPHCTFFGYRYVSITSTGNVAIKSLKSIPVTSIAKELETGTITTGNDLVNKLISNTYWGSYPTICLYPPTVRNATSAWDGQQTHKCLPKPVRSLLTL